MVKLLVPLMCCALTISCKVKPPAEPAQPAAGPSQPQQSTFCSSAYPNGIAQEDPASPPSFTVSVNAGGFDGHWGIGFQRAAESLTSSTSFSVASDDSGLVPHLIAQLLVNDAAPYEMNVTVSGRETMQIGATPDGGADARILFAFSLPRTYDNLTSIHEAAAEQVALHVIGGWTCNGDFATPTRRF